MGREWTSAVSNLFKNFLLFFSALDIKCYVLSLDNIFILPSDSTNIQEVRIFSFMTRSLTAARSKMIHISRMTCETPCYMALSAQYM